MNQQSEKLDTQKLELWLRELEGALSDVSVVDRSDIVMEMNSHIREAFSRGDRSLSDILQALGEPTQVASRYRVERGFAPVKIQTRTGRFFKWATLSLLGIFLIIIISTILFVRSFFPLVKIDDKEGRVQILGGLIDVKSDDIDLDTDGNIGFSFGGQGSNSRLSGTLLQTGLKGFSVSATNGQIKIQADDTAKITYKCSVRSQRPISLKEINHQPTPNVTAFDFPDETAAVDCEFTIPKDLEVSASLRNGGVDLREMHQDVKVDLQNGRVRFGRDPRAIYEVNARIDLGKISGLEEFNELQIKEGKQGPHFKAQLRVNNGKISLLN